jgi:TPR repeat protein
MLVSRQYLAGKYRPKDLDKADEYAYQAALLGNTEALNAIAVNFFYGQGVELDRTRSDQLFRTLAYIGSNRSTIAIARNYSKGPSARVYESRAFAYYTKAAYNGSITAMMELGRSYLAGAGTEQDDGKGVLWLERAADRHNTDAMTQLYFHYFIQNPTINNPDAEKWLDRLVAEDVPDMIVRKAVLLNTRDPKANREQVFALLDHAEKLGSQFARRLKNVYVRQERGDE